MWTIAKHLIDALLSTLNVISLIFAFGAALSIAVSLVPVPRVTWVQRLQAMAFGAVALLAMGLGYSWLYPRTGFPGWYRWIEALF